MTTGAMTEEETAALDFLRRTWRDRYRIEVTDGVWRASRMGNATVVIAADTSEELRGLIFADFSEWTRESRRWM
jgi:hypothetical protein